MKNIIFFMIILAILTFGCAENKVIVKEGNQECKIDADCIAAGCSGQLCLPKDKAKDIMTTCEFRPEYDCLKLTSCSCAQGKCNWENTTEYNTCLKEKKSSKGVPIT